MIEYEVFIEEGEKGRFDWVKDSEKWLDLGVNVFEGWRYRWSCVIIESDLES